MREARSGTRLWQEARGIPAALDRTLGDARGFENAARLLADGEVGRIVATGNGAAYYVAQALWLVSLEGAAGPEIVAVPAGLLSARRFAWRAGDRLLVVSSSGEQRDAIVALEAGAPRPYVAVTASEASTIAADAAAAAFVQVDEQETETHTQAYCGNLAAALTIWSLITGDVELEASLARAPAQLDRLLVEAEARETEADLPSSAVAFGAGAAWAAAQEAALLLKEVAGVPAEGLETREGATSGMFALGPQSLAVSLPTGENAALAETEEACRGTGAAVLRLPGGDAVEARLAGLSTFPAALALAIELGLRAGLDVDHPPWVDAYYRATRVRE